MKLIMFIFVLTGIVSISQSMSTQNQIIKDEINQKIKSLKHLSSDMHKQLKDTHITYPEEQKQRMINRKSQSCDSFNGLRDEAFVNLQNAFDEYSDVAFGQMRNSLVVLVHEGEVGINELISFLQNNGYTSTQLAEIQSISQNIQDDASIMQQLISDIENQCYSINEMRIQVSRIENLIDKDKRAKEDTRPRIYLTLRATMNEWYRGIKDFEIKLISIADKLEFAFPEKIEELLRNS